MNPLRKLSLFAIGQRLSSNLLQCRNSPQYNLSLTRHYREKKRFYKNVSISQSGSKSFEINLDKRKLKTPNGQQFVVPSESLAVAVATEWDSQQEVIKQHSMHFTALCNTVLDNPTHRTKAQIIRSMLHFLETDTLCYRLDDPPELAAMQQKEWEPVVEWLNRRYEVNVTSTTSIAGPDIPQDTYQTLQHHLETHTDWALIGYENATHCLKSLILAFALMDREIGVEKAARLSRLELEFQIEKWGSVEWAHDTEFADTKARVAAAVLFTHLVTEQRETVQKTNAH